MEVRESKGITETIRQKLGLGMIEETCILDYAVCDRIAETIMDYCDRKIKLKIEYDKNIESERRCFLQDYKLFFYTIKKNETI